MTMYLSPLVDVNEIDLTTTIPAVATSIGVIVARNTWKGPELKVQLVNNIDELVEVFGRPEEANGNLYQSYEDIIAGAGFLQYGTNLYCTRVLPVSATFGGVYGTIGNLASSSSSSSSSTCPLTNNPWVDKSNQKWWEVLTGTARPIASGGGYESGSLYGGTEQAVLLQELDNWVDGFRPTQMSITWTSGANEPGFGEIIDAPVECYYTLRDKSNDIISSTASGSFSGSGGIFDITWGSQNMNRLLVDNWVDVGNAKNFIVTDIQFFNCASCTQQWVESVSPDGEDWHIDYGVYNSASGGYYENNANGGWEIQLRRNSKDGFGGGEVPPFPQKLKIVLQPDFGDRIIDLKVLDLSYKVLVSAAMPLSGGSLPLSGGELSPTTFVWDNITYAPSAGSYYEKNQPLKHIQLDGGSDKINITSIQWWDDCNSSSSSSSA